MAYFRLPQISHAEAIALPNKIAVNFLAQLSTETNYFDILNLMWYQVSEF